MGILVENLNKLTDFRWLNLFQVDYTTTDGKKGKWQFASRKKDPQPSTAPIKPDAVVIVPILNTPEGNKVIVIKEFRIPLGDYEYGFPAGLFEPNESIESTTARELKEETGLDLTRVLCVSQPLISSAGLSDESVALVFVECTGTPSTAGNEGTEDITIVPLDVQGIKALRTSGVKMSAKTWPVLLMFEALGKIEWTL